MNDLLNDAMTRASRYLDSLPERRAFPSEEALAGLRDFDEPLPDAPTDPAQTLALLDEAGSPATVASAGGRYFGFVIGGAVPASLAANWLAGAWDQNGFSITSSPVAAALERIALRWLLDVLNLPPEAEVGFVSGATMANFSGLAAARHAILARQGWDVEAQGLFGAPPITVVVGEEVHVSLLKALSMVGFGRDRVIRVPVDDQGRMRANALPPLDASTIVCIQAGNVNSGAFDPAAEIVAKAHEAGAWVHVDGAFGLWILADPARAHLAAGVPDADSWACDAHKWLNVPYDSGLVFCRNAEHLRAAMSVSAAYLVNPDVRDPARYTPELSRRARGIEVWAALRSLGRQGLADMIERTCLYAAHIADCMREAGFEIVNDVEINQVLVSFGDADRTRRVIARMQADGILWAGGTEWHGRTALRISVSSWATTEADVERSIQALMQAARAEQ
jgi:glutamate/tyrosine decarboxylase-like PLP-dependent enzyme